MLPCRLPAISLPFVSLAMSASEDGKKPLDIVRTDIVLRRNVEARKQRLCAQVERRKHIRTRNHGRHGGDVLFRRRVELGFGATAHPLSKIGLVALRRKQSHRVCRLLGIVTEKRYRTALRFAAFIRKHRRHFAAAFFAVCHESRRRGVVLLLVVVTEYNRGDAAFRATEEIAKRLRVAAAESHIPRHGWKRKIIFRAVGAVREKFVVFPRSIAIVGLRLRVVGHEITHLCKAVTPAREDAVGHKHGKQSVGDFALADDGDGKLRVAAHCGTRRVNAILSRKGQKRMTGDKSHRHIVQIVVEIRFHKHLRIAGIGSIIPATVVETVLSGVGTRRKKRLPREPFRCVCDYLP